MAAQLFHDRSEPGCILLLRMQLADLYDENTIYIILIRWS
jgi:hypothetical protein